MVTLTNPQLSLLRKAAREPTAVRPGGKTVTALRKADLVEWDGEAGSGTWWLQVTETARALLKANET